MPFNLSSDTRTLLDKAAQASFKISKVVITNMIVTEPGGKYYSDRQRINVFAGEDTSFQSARTFTNLEQRSACFARPYSASPGMVKNPPQTGAKYPVSDLEKTGS